MLNSLKQQLKRILQRLQRNRAAEKLKQQANHISAEQLQHDLQQLGVQQGDTLFLHSSLKSLGYVVGGPATVIKVLQQLVGEQGNILLPAYYLPGGTIEATCQLTDYQFDPRIHGTHMGRLPETFLQLPGVKRSLHPTHSVAVWGAQADYLTNGHHQAPSVFGEGSPWQRFTALPQAKVLGLGISMGPVTFYHLLEDQLGEAFPLNVWHQEYCLPCIDQDNQIWQVPVKSYKPELTQQRIDHPSRADLREFFRQSLQQAGLLQQTQVGDSQSWLLPAAGFLTHLQWLAERGITIYTPEAELAQKAANSP